MLPFGLTASPKGPGPVWYWSPSGSMILPPGRMVCAPGRRIAVRVPAGARWSKVVSAATEVRTAARMIARRMGGARLYLRDGVPGNQGDDEPKVLSRSDGRNGDAHTRLGG